MLSITLYLIANPMIALGLIILVVLGIYNVLRRQASMAMGSWLLILVVLFYIYSQTSRPGADGPHGIDEFDEAELPGDAMEELVQP
jgi:hypothetical protein